MACEDPDIVVVGSGHNGLVAACVLAGAGFRVLVLEAHPARAGGAVQSEEATLPGFVHDVGAGFFPLVGLSPAFRALALEGDGLAWCHAALESCHVAPDGTYAAISRDVDVAAKQMGSPEDGDAWRRLVGWHTGIADEVLTALLGPLPPLLPLARLFPGDLARLMATVLRSGRSLALRHFKSEAARRVMPSLAMHVDVGPDDALGAAVGYVLAMTAATGGYAVPKGGAASLTGALLKRLAALSVEVRLGARVTRVLVSEGNAVGVVLQDGSEIRAQRAVLADVSAPDLFLRMVPPEHVPPGVLRRMERFPRGWGTLKMDWALSGPVPWKTEAARRSAVVHVADSVDDLARAAGELRANRVPGNLPLVVGQQSVADPSRAPPGKHTLWAYTHVPSAIEGGWKDASGRVATAVEERIEALAPGFKALVEGRRVVSPDDLEAMDANLRGGDIGGGSNTWRNQLMFRPAFPYFRYRTPLPGLYLCSGDTHPGAGVHGMGGHNAAQRIIDDFV